MTLVELFELSPEERARLDARPFRGTDEAGWVRFSELVQAQVLQAYAEGEITLERALEAVWSCSLGCTASQRATLLAVTARGALQSTPKSWKGKRPQPPTWIRVSAYRLLEMLHEDRPGEPFIPNEDNHWTTKIFEDAIRWLVTLGLSRPMSQRTLYAWYLAGKAEVQRNSTSTV